MFWTFFRFELKQRLRSVSTYIFFLIPFTMMFFSVSVSDFGPIGGGRVLVNGPFALTVNFIQLTGFGIILIAAIFGPAILRDFQQDTYSLIFTKPISKFAYLGGKWAASFVTTVFVFSGLVWGGVIGTFMPWADKSRLAPIHLGTYLQPFFSITVVNIFFLGALFFAVAALSRRITVVYLQGVALLALYLILAISVLTSNRLERFWPSLVDPLGLIFGVSITRYWTPVERNTRLLQWSGVFLDNRLLWIAVGILALIVTYILFPMSAELLAGRKANRKAREAAAVEEEEKKVRPRAVTQLPQTSIVFNRATTGLQFLSLTRIRLRNILREIPFWAIVLLMMIFAGVNGWFAGEVNGVKVWPVTFLMLNVLQGGASLFLYIVAALYAGELIWRERDVRFDQIHDALPYRDATDWFSRFAALAIAETILITAVMAVGILMQTVAGFFRFEIGHYLEELYLIALPSFLIIILLALFVHTLVSNKFIGHAIVVGFTVLIPILYRYGIENRLLLYGEITPYTYSAMNRYGHFVPALFWILFYWLMVGAVLSVLAIALSRRGTEMSMPARRKLFAQRFPKLMPYLAAFLLAAVASGAWFYYNTHVLNEFRTAKDIRHLQAEYERRYKKYERFPQPKITAVDVNVDLFPERRSFQAAGYYLLVNRTSQPIGEIHISNAQESIDEIRFDRPFHVTLDDKKYGFAIYQLDQPLEPGQTLRMDFRASVTSRGFRDGNERPQLAFNGTFFDRDFFPLVGYDWNRELDEPVRRREEKLGLLEPMAPRGDPYYSYLTLFAPDSEWISFRATVSTSPDQIAIAPGYLKREWTQNGRRYFEYDMGDNRINNFWSFISGNYAVRRDNWKNVKLEVYYNPGDEYNIDKMIDSAKAGLDYYEANFGPYQFNQYRVLEFPRYRSFAQSFPNTVPFSEEIGFIERRKKDDDLDILYFVNAHELAHQWWGHQLIGSMTQGSNMMSESLAEYSALRVMDKKYGPDVTRKFLKYELDRYLRGRGGETRQEPPLALVEREAYVWYQKGALVMYALSDYIGEDQVNAALRDFLQKNKFATGPYPDTRGFVAAMRDRTPPELQYLISDMFESIVLYENKAVTATAVPDGKKYRVTLTVDAQKRKADGAGNETPVQINDLIEVGVFSGTKEHLKPLHMEKQWFRTENQTLEFVVDEKPTFAGIDPYNKLIDRNPTDNLIAVEVR